MRKGNIVQLNIEQCFTVENGGTLKYAYYHIGADVEGWVPGYRRLTQQELDSWYASDESKGMTSDGETKLPPRCTLIKCWRDKLYHVVRARAKAVIGWGKTGGFVEIVCTETGEQFCVKRDLLEVVVS